MAKVILIKKAEYELNEEMYNKIPLDTFKLLTSRGEKSEDMDKVMLFGSMSEFNNTVTDEDMELFDNTKDVLISDTGKIFYYLSGIVLAFVVILALYIFPVIAAFANTLRNLLKNAFLFAFMHFPSTLTIAVISILPMYMTYRDLKLLPLYACCWFFFGFGLPAYINSFFFYRMFRPYIETSENEEAISVIDDEHPQ